VSQSDRCRINTGHSGGPLVDYRKNDWDNTFYFSLDLFPARALLSRRRSSATVDTLIRDGKTSTATWVWELRSGTQENAKFFEVTDNIVPVTQSSRFAGCESWRAHRNVVKQLNGKSVSDAGELQVEVGQKGRGRPFTCNSARWQKRGRSGDFGQLHHRKEEVSENTGEHGKARWGSFGDSRRTVTRFKLPGM